MLWQWILSVFMTVILLLFGCSCHRNVSRRDTQHHTRIVMFSDHTGSTTSLQKEIIQLATQIAVSAPPKTIVEASTFGSDIPVAPFYTGTIRKPATFNTALKAALAKPMRGRGTFGAPLLKRVRERVHLSQYPTFAVILSDCGFNDLPEMRKEAELLAKEPKLLALYAMPAVSDSSAYTKLEAALKPLGNRVRIAASADASEAIREIQSILRKGGK